MIDSRRLRQVDRGHTYEAACERRVVVIKAPPIPFGCYCVFTSVIWKTLSKCWKYETWSYTTFLQNTPSKIQKHYKVSIRLKYIFGKKIFLFVRCGVRTHAHFREPELKSGALDRSANLTSMNESVEKVVFETRLWRNFRFFLYFHHFAKNIFSLNQLLSIHTK